MAVHSTLSSIQVADQVIYFTSSEKMDALEDESIPLIITSPPYWDVRDYGGESTNQLGIQQSYDRYIAGLNRVWSECLRVLQPNGKICINVQPLPISNERSGFKRRIIRDIMFDIEQFMFEHEMFLSGMIFWDKSPYINNVAWGSYPKPTNIAINTAFEQIYTFVKPGATRKVPADILSRSLLKKEEWRHWAVRWIWDDISPVIKINAKKENIFGHGAPFPEDIPYRLIRMHSIEGEKVLDPFLGSGTTLKMARITHRQGIGYEINPDFADLIKSRIQESWTPPPIDSQYKTLAVSQIADIIQISIDEETITPTDILESDSDNKKDFDIQRILKRLKREKILSDANIEYIKKIFTQLSLKTSKNYKNDIDKTVQIKNI